MGRGDERGSWQEKHGGGGGRERHPRHNGQNEEERDTEIVLRCATERRCQEPTTEGNHLYASPSVNESATEFRPVDGARACDLSSAILAWAALFAERLDILKSVAPRDMALFIVSLCQPECRCVCNDSFKQTPPLSCHRDVFDARAQHFLASGNAQRVACVFSPSPCF